MPDRRHFVAASLWALAGFGAGLPLQALHANSADTHRAPQASEVKGRILVIGDSLSAEYGLPQGSGWVAHIAERLQKEGTGYQIHNSSISGDTTSGGLSRMPADLERSDPDIVIIELGANDALRGLSLDVARDNLAQMIRLAQEHDAHIVLAGMQIPPNYGPRYAKQFAGMFPDLAQAHQATLVPFLLEGFATRPEMFLDDGIHPAVAAQSIIADTVWEHLAPLLQTD